MLSVGGQSFPIVSKWLMMVLPRSADNPRTQSYETDNPSLWSVATRSFYLVLLQCTKCTENQWQLHLPLFEMPGVLAWLMTPAHTIVQLSNIINCEKDRAGCDK